MAEKPPPYNPHVQQPYQSPYPPPPPPYYPQMPPPPTGTTTIVTGVPQPGGSTTIVTGPNYGSIPSGQPVIVRASTDVIMVGGCPACRVGVLNEEFTLGGLCCAFWFFPLGLLCCLAMRERRCTNCCATFS